MEIRSSTPAARLPEPRSIALLLPLAGRKARERQHQSAGQETPERAGYSRKADTGCCHEESDGSGFAAFRLLEGGHRGTGKGTDQGKTRNGLDQDFRRKADEGGDGCGQQTEDDIAGTGDDGRPVAARGI